MKKPLLTLALLLFTAASPLVAADAEPKPVSVEQRLRETDLAIALKHYERVQMEIFESTLKKDLMSTEELPDGEREKRLETLAKRIVILSKRSDELRERLLRLGREATAIKAK